MITLLKFPSTQDFFEWLKKRGIHEYGSVITQKIVSSKQGVPFITHEVRMTAKDPARSEIVRCEIQFYHEIWISREHNMKDAEPAENKLKEYILNLHKEVFKDYEMAVLPAEFDLEEEKI